MGLVIMENCEKFGGEQARVLHRDNVRFGFWYDNGKPILPENCGTEIVVVPTLQLIRERKDVVTA